MEFTGTITYTFKNDYMFKAVLQKNPNALKGLLASLLHIPINEIKDVHIENPIVLGETIDNKTVVLDINVSLNNDQQINIEMQVISQPYWRERSLTYVCKLFNQLDVGENYENAIKTIHIGILDFELFPGEELFYSQNVFMDRNTQRIYSDKLAIHVLCLKHIENATPSDKECGLYDWAKLFAATTWEELKMLANNNDSIKEAVGTFRQLTEDQRIRIQCEARRRNQRDWNTMQLLIDRANKEAERQKAEADMMKAEAEKQKAEADKQKAEADKQKAEADKQKAEVNKAQEAVRQLQQQLAALQEKLNAMEDTTRS